MSSLLQMFFDDSSSSSDDDDDFFDMTVILLTGIAMNERAKHGGSVPRRKGVRRKLFDDYSTDDESTAMACAFSSTNAPSSATAPASAELTAAPQSRSFPPRFACAAAGRKKPLRPRRAATAGSRSARRRGCVAHAEGEDGVPTMDLSADEAPMRRHQKRKAWMQAKRKEKEVQAGGNSAKEEAGTKDGLHPAGPATRRGAKPNPKYFGSEWVC